MTWALVWGWYGQIWPNLAASVICAVWLDARNQVRHHELLHGRRRRRAGGPPPS